jgi:hypothetical protein
MAETPKPGPGSKPEPRFSNQKTPAEFAMEELKKTAASRGIPVETLIAQMVEQYLREDKKE